jgi:hemerythrin-like domain-containing protein
MKATDVLKSQHRELLALFERIDVVDDPTDRRRLLDEITDALEMHAELEEEVFYPAIRESGARAAEALVLEAIEAHHVVDLILAEAPDMDPEDETFIPKMKVLRDLVTRHIEEEERELFALASGLGDDEAEDLGRRLQEQTAWVH